MVIGTQLIMQSWAMGQKIVKMAKSKKLRFGFCIFDFHNFAFFEIEKNFKKLILEIMSSR